MRAIGVRCCDVFQSHVKGAFTCGLKTSLPRKTRPARSSALTYGAVSMVYNAIRANKQDRFCLPVLISVAFVIVVIAGVARPPAIEGVHFIALELVLRQFGSSFVFGLWFCRHKHSSATITKRHTIQNACKFNPPTCSRLVLLSARTTFRIFLNF